MMLLASIPGFSFELGPVTPPTSALSHHRLHWAEEGGVAGSGSFSSGEGVGLQEQGAGLLDLLVSLMAHTVENPQMHLHAETESHDCHVISTSATCSYGQCK